MSKKLTLQSAAISSLFFVFIMLVSYLDPLSATDDLNFLNLASDTSTSIFHQALMYGNGRLLGNMLAMLMAKYLGLRTILKPVVMTCIMLLIWNIFHMDNLISKFIFAVMFAFLPDFLFAQTINWTSGFANYVPPVLTFLLCVYLIKILTNDNPGYSLTRRIILLCVLCITSICNQLFVEHMSFTAVVISLSVIICCKKQGTRLFPAMLWFVSSVTGFLLMVYIQNINYTKTFVASYRGSSHDISRILSTLYNNLTYVTLSDLCNYKLYFFLLFLSAILYIEKYKLPNKRLILCVITISSLYCIICAPIADILPLQLLFCATALWCTYILRNSYIRKNLIVLIPGIISIIPLQIISPYGSRCLMFLYICMIVFLSKMLENSISLITSFFSRKLLLLICALFISANVSIITINMIKIHSVYTYNQTSIRQGMLDKQTTIDIKITHSSYFHGAVGGGYESIYYYHNKGDITFNNIEEQ